LSPFYFFFLFAPHPLVSFPRCLASGAGSEPLIWLPVKQQPFNNNAIVPHSSSPVSLTHPAVCRWYIVCGFQKHSPFLRGSPPHTHTAAIFNSRLNIQCSAALCLPLLLFSYLVTGQLKYQVIRVCVCVCGVGGKPRACASQPPRGGGHLEEAFPRTQRKEEESRPEISSAKDITGFH